MSQESDYFQIIDGQFVDGLNTDVAGNSINWKNVLEDLEDYSDDSSKLGYLSQHQQMRVLSYRQHFKVAHPQDCEYITSKSDPHRIEEYDRQVVEINDALDEFFASSEKDVEAFSTALMTKIKQLLSFLYQREI